MGTNGLDRQLGVTRARRRLPRPNCCRSPHELRMWQGRIEGRIEALRSKLGAVLLDGPAATAKRVELFDQLDEQLGLLRSLRVVEEPP
jgi:hypothetical protein